MSGVHVGRRAGATIGAAIGAVVSVPVVMGVFGAGAGWWYGHEKSTQHMENSRGLAVCANIAEEANNGDVYKPATVTNSKDIGTLALRCGFKEKNSQTIRFDRFGRMNKGAPVLTAKQEITAVNTISPVNMRALSNSEARLAGQKHYEYIAIGAGVGLILGFLALRAGGRTRQKFQNRQNNAKQTS